MKEDFFIFTLISGLVLAFGIYISIKSWKNLKKKDMYEFQNRTDGGVVKFDSYEKSVNHERSKSLNNCLLIFGVLVVLISFFFFKIFVFVLIG